MTRLNLTAAFPLRDAVSPATWEISEYVLRAPQLDFSAALDRAARDDLGLATRCGLLPRPFSKLAKPSLRRRT